jgi:hypothetical protein
MPHAPTARGTATAVTLRATLLAELGPHTDVEVGELVPDSRFDSLQFLYEGTARETSGVAADRLRLRSATPEDADRDDPEARPDWARAYDRFDTDYGDGSKLGGPIDRWMTATDLHSSPHRSSRTARGAASVPSSPAPSPWSARTRRCCGASRPPRSVTTRESPPTSSTSRS